MGSLWYWWSDEARTRKTASVSYLNGKRHGPDIRFGMGNNITEITEYRDGIKDGEQAILDDSGNAAQVNYYRNGVAVWSHRK